MPSYTVVLRTHPFFLLKVVSNFHLNQEMILPVFVPHHDCKASAIQHTLNVNRALKFYLDSSSANKSYSLFITYGDQTPGSEAAIFTIVRWMVSCIKKCYEVRALVFLSRWRLITPELKQLLWPFPSTFLSMKSVVLLHGRPCGILKAPFF